MRYELINTGSYLLVVSDDEIKESDIFYMNNDVIDCTYIKVKPKGDAKKIIAHLPLNGAAILDLPLLPPLEQEDDAWKHGLEDELNKLPYTKHLDDGQYNDGQLAGFEFGANWGFNKAKEKYFKPIPNWVYTRLCTYDNRNPYYLPYDEDDITRKPTDCNCDNCFYGRTKMAEFILSIQSLSQPKMPVAFECEVEHIGSQEDGDFEEPKKYTNSQGQTVLIGRYIYE
jgi:hypothetical protein